MKILFCSVGKAHEPFVKTGIENYTKRIINYFPAEWLLIAPPKNTALSEAEQKKQEAISIRQILKEGDYLAALDERGTALTSEALSQFIQQRASSSVKRLVFLVGGAFGSDQTILAQAAFTWSLSPLTFPHQLVRLILAEQVYRACTILRNEKYHHR
jgi:23S rRNA (pseudouridine1915-N3)-methyltransferase